MFNLFRKIFYQPRRPFPITAPIAYQLTTTPLAQLMGIKPFSSIMYVTPAWRKKFSQLDINERVIENPFIFQHLPKSINKKILDVGCCETILPIQLASLGFNVTGIDMRPYELTHPNFSFKKEDICQTQLKPNQFDVITCISTLEHIGLDTIYGKSDTKSSDKKALQKMLALLKPKGRLLLTVPVAKKYVQTDFMQIYTTQKLHSLLKDFKITQENYYIPSSSRSQWSPCLADHLPLPPNFGVITMVAVKA
ncbi:class I SAM-dependent methyltransferase [Patescibacteria group bacterium]|nr:class I SAM-dependent methyltransferase [Patescibacteria group bacterium]MBU2543582.1 class I SAM-dependent methyltransferase [Patescibacteria group bacterium]